MKRVIGILSIAGVAAGLIGLAAASETARAQDGMKAPARAVLELFTSQGCSSCPPADALLESYAKRRDLIALTFPVDYWDYLGWKDTLASPKFTARQRHYAKQRGDGRIYTPQVVVNGVTHAVGNSAQEIDRGIEAASPRLAGVALSVKLDKGAIVIEAGDGVGTESKDATVWLALTQSTVEIQVKSGENRGKTLRYFNVVRELTPVGMWSGKALTIRLDKETVKLTDTDCAAVILQSGKAGPIIAAAWLPKL